MCPISQASVVLISRCALGNNDHRKKQMLLLLASTLYEVPKSALKDKANGKEQNIKKLVNTLIRRKPVLPETLENSLLSYSLVMEKTILALSPKLSREWHSNSHLKWHFIIKNQYKFGSETHPASYPMGTGVKRGRGVTLTTHPI
jgi:hypothetical protein